MLIISIGKIHFEIVHLDLLSFAFMNALILENQKMKYLKILPLWQVVVESFYKNDNAQLKKHTTAESYAPFMAIQGMIATGNNSPSNFKLIQETVDGDVAWVKFSTSYEEKPETFKLIKVDGKWKVTEKGLKEKAPF